MKTTSKVLIGFGILIVIVGQFIFRNLNHVNAVDTHAWTININGIGSFPWVTFSGGVLFIVGLIFYISCLTKKGRRFH